MTAATDADKDFVDELVKGYGVGEGVGWMMWVEGCMGKIPKKLHRRLIVVCKYRLLVIKKGGLFSKNALEKELPWFDLIEIREQAKEFLALDFRSSGLATQSATLASLSAMNSQSGVATASFAPPDADNTRSVVLPALNPDLTVHMKAAGDKLTEFIVHVRSQYRHLCWGVPDAINLKLSVYGELLQDLSSFTPTAAAHYEWAYLARCSTLGRPSSDLFLRAVSDLSQEHHTSLSLEHVPGCDPKSDVPVVLQPALAALAHNTYFTELISRDLPWEAIDSIALGAALRTNTTLLKLVVSRANLNDLSEVGYGLAANPWHKTVHLDLSNNSLNDKTVSALTEALAVYPHGLRVLNLENCGISARALQGLFDGAFCKNYGMSLSIQELYVGGNTMGAEGSAGFDKWLDQVKSHAQLRRLSIAGVNAVNVGTLCKFITPCAPKLAWFDMSNNKIEETDLQFVQTLLAALHSHSLDGSVSATGALDDDSPHSLLPVVIRLCNTQLSLRGVQVVLQTIRSNHLAKNIALDLAGNPGVDEKTMPTLAPELQQCTAITRLSVAECRLKLKGIQSLLPSLPPYVIELSLEDTFAGAESDELAIVVGRWLATTPIERLNICGSKNAHLRRSLIPLFSYLNTSLTLKYLHLDYNYMGDAGAFKLQEALRDNKTLLQVTLDRNQLSISGFEAMLSGIKKCKYLTSIGAPHVDLDKARSLCGSERRQAQLSGIWFELQTLLLKNGASTVPLSVFSPLEDFAISCSAPEVLQPLASPPNYLLTAPSSLESTKSYRVTQKPSPRPVTTKLDPSPRPPADPSPAPPVAPPQPPPEAPPSMPPPIPQYSVSDLDDLPPPPMEAPPPPPPI